MVAAMFVVKRRVSLLVGLLVCGILALFVVTRFHTTTDMSAFFPEGEQRTKARVSKALSTGELSRTLVVSLEGKSPSEAAAMSARLEALLTTDAALMPHLAYINGQPPTGIDEALWQLYNPRRLAFFAATPEQARAELSDAALDRALQHLAEGLASPVSPLLGRVAPEDPFLIVPTLLQSLMSASPSLAIEQGRYVAGGKYGVVFLATHAPAMNSAVQSQVLAGLERAYTTLRSEYPEIRIESSGFARFADSTQRQIQGDISRIAVISIVSLTAFCWLLFRSLRLIVLLQVPIAFGMLAALAATLAVWGSVHGVTLAVGASLIGVAMDYVLHFYAHLRLCPDPDGPLATMRHITVALMLGALTTIVGFAVLGASPFPALVQIATFSAVGVGAALVATLTVVPHLVRRNEPAAPTLVKVAGVLADAVQVFHGRPWIARGLLLAAAALSVVGIMRVQWQDDLSALTVPDPLIAAEDARVRQRITSLDTRRIVVALGVNEEESLRVNAAIGHALERAQAAGEIDGYQGIGRMLPPAVTQQAVFDAVQQADLPKRLPQALARAGFNEEGFAPFFEFLRRPPPEPLTFDAVAQSPAVDLVRAHRIRLNDAEGTQTAFLTFLRGVRNPEAVERRIQAISDALYVDQAALMTDATRSHRVRTSQLLCAGLVGVFLVLLIQYRNLRSAVAATIPAVLSATVTIAVLGLVGVPLNILGLTSLLMVLSLGVDYAVFLVDAGDGVDLDSQRGLGATMTGLLVSWISNLCGFGLLAMSQQPAMRLIGLIAGIGVTCALLFAPTALVLGRNGISPIARAPGPKFDSAGHARLR